MADCRFRYFIPSIECFQTPCEVRLLRGFYFIPARCHHGWMKGFLVLPVLLIFLFDTPAFADFQKGLDAYDSGDYAAALKEWLPLAEQGDASVQYNLGQMYYKGLGVTQDYTRAHMWWNIAGSLGNKFALETRDEIAKEMTPSQIENAQDLARECVAKNYKGC